MMPEMPKCALVVDDDEEFLFYVQTALESAGYDVETAASLMESQELLRRRSFAVILADLRLPGASGLDVLDEARKIDSLAVGIVLTGHSSVSSALQALREGAYDYLLKPCPPEELAAAVGRAVEHYHLKVSLVQKTAELEKLEAQLDVKSRALQDVSHELKNPLSVVSGYSALLLKRGGESYKPEELRKGLQSIYSNAQHLNRLLDDLMESTRVSARKVTLSKSRLSAREAASEAVENLRLEAAKKGIELSCETGDEELFIEADKHRLTQILLNLLGNALKFTPSGGKVRISLKSLEDCARFCVQDTGVGIDPAETERLFERFYQAEGTRLNHKGLGLGLEISKGLVEMHDGKIWVESRPGMGASFYFTIPLAQDREPRPLRHPRHLTQ
ncbi:MAG: hybrid sensor histidine kinase/response regulator [Elusimicrobia bacterium]|nr:hybrid sensor histidine kinase/response regulator [Elusimicrobiota bacterium]